MGTKLETKEGSDLYQFWGQEISRRINDDMEESPGEKTLINLASNEYFKSVHEHQIEGNVVTPCFLDRKEGGDYKIVSFYAKRARGAMASWIIRNRVTSSNQFTGFDENGYRYDVARSELNQPVFVRSN
jgi:hypothetical protein